MEFNFDINKVLKSTISIISGNQNHTNYAELQEITDTAGIKSAQAQRLPAPITSLSKLRISSHRLYILTDKTSATKATAVLGFLKVGVKQLFVLDHEGNHHQTHPLCVLDFYVHESQQRKGYGLKLFKHMLQSEQVHPSHLAIDRPSQKFTSFLRKHFNLWATIPQVNNFVVFEGYFKNRDDRNNRRHNRPNQNCDEFRPLSRAYTEGVLHHSNRSIEALNGVRPASNTYGDGDYYAGRTSIHNDHRSNVFSRYATENVYVPSHPERKRRAVRQEEEIVTNPYRNTRNPRTKFIEEARMQAGRHQEEMSRNEISPIPDLDLHSDSPASDEVLFNRNHSASKDSTHKLFQADNRDETKTESTYHDDLTDNAQDVSSTNQLRNELFEAKLRRNSLRSYRYKKPSDMIDELKKKDELGSTNATYLHRYALGSSSWNVFGIPSPSRFANR